MKKTLKKYAVISIVINVLLLMIYLCCFHFRTAFTGEKNIISTTKIFDKASLKDNARTIDRITFYLNMRPKLKTSVFNLFANNEFIVNSFFCLKDSLLMMDNFSMKEADIIFDEYNYALSSLQNYYDTGMWDSQREAKLKDSEVEAKIANFKQHFIEENRIYQDDFKGFSKKLDVIFTAMENHVTLAHHVSNNDFAGISGGRYCGPYNRKFPIGLDTYNQDVKKGKAIDIAIGIGLIVRSQSEFYTVSFDGKKIEMGGENYKLKLNADSIGKQKIEAVIHWMNPYDNELGSDTTYFEYTVTP